MTGDVLRDALRGARALRDFVRDARRTGGTAAAAPSFGTKDHSSTVTEALARLDAIRDECRSLVNRRASLSAGAAILPVPGLDVGTDIAILLKLLPAINERFGLAPEQVAALDTETKRLVMMFAGTVGSTLVGRLVTRDVVVRILMKLGVRVTTKGVVKFVPLIGQAVSASISFGAMKLLGNRHVDDCYEVAKRTLLAEAGASPGGEWQVVD